MQPTPFSGLLTVIHISVVIYYKLFNFLFPNGIDTLKRLKYSPSLLTGISILIITSIFIFSFASAVLSVHASMVDKNSTVKIVSELIDSKEVQDVFVTAKGNASYHLTFLFRGLVKKKPKMVDNELLVSLDKSEKI